MVGKTRTILTNTRFDDLPNGIQDLLNEYVYIIVDDLCNELPLVRSHSSY